MGPVQLPDGMDKQVHPFSDAAWNEKLAAVILTAGIVIIGVAPFYLQHLVSPTSQSIIQNIAKAGY